MAPAVHHIPLRDFTQQWAADRDNGLPSAEAARRLAATGPNELAAETARPPQELLLRQLASPMVLLLIGAGVLSILAGEPKDAAAILAIVVLNAALGFLQDYRAERALAALRDLAAPVARARRDGQWRTLPARELVPGDLILLEAGELVPADARLLDAAGLQLQEAALTGEPAPVAKSAEAALAEDTPLGDRVNMVYTGCGISRGRGHAVVTATGPRTELGRIASLTARTTMPATPLERRIGALALRLSFVALALAAMVAVMGIARGQDWREMLLVGISLAVAAVPEGLAAVITVALALGSQRMLARHALIRRLSSVETLGSVTVICTDKTGTITENRMRLSTVTLEQVGDRATALAFAALCTDVERDSSGAFTGDPLEIAIVEAAAEHGEQRTALVEGAPRVAELVFDSHRKRMTTIHAAAPWMKERAGVTAPFVAVCKGALELWRDEPHPAALRGERVLGLAVRPLDAIPADLAEAEREMTLIACLGFADPIRPEVPAAIAACRDAGIRTVILTGDHPATAAAVATQVLGRAEPGVDYYARITPEQKLRLVESLQGAGEVVAMTGDGVNDAPALKRANVGVAMGRIGTGVAREAADAVLLDDNFATIAAAVEEGRRVFQNVRQVVRYLLASNASEIAVMLIAPLAGMPLPLTPLQILWINLVTDSLPALALATEPAVSGIMREPPRQPGEPMLDRRHMGLLVISAVLLTLCGFLLPGWTFLVLAQSQLFLSFACRSPVEPFWRLGWFTNRVLVYAVAGSTALQLSLFAIPAAREVLALPPFPIESVVGCLLISLIPLLGVEVWKLRRSSVADAR